MSGEIVAVSEIVLWKLTKLVQLKRLELDFEDAGFGASLRTVAVFPITLHIAHQSSKLDFRADPADEIIAATSIVESAPLPTRDRPFQTGLR